MSKVLIMEDIVEKLKTINPKIIIEDDKYINSKTKLKCKCLVCNEIIFISWEKLLMGRGCKYCKSKKMKDKMDEKRLTIEHCKEVTNILNPNIELISEVYINSSKKMAFKCKVDGYLWNVSWNNFTRMAICPECSGNRKDYSIGNIIEKIYDINPDIKVLSKEYFGAHHKLDVVCEVCGNVWKSSWDNIRSGTGCPKCALKRNSGKNSCKYNHNITDEERLIGRTYFAPQLNKWRSAVYARDKYICQCCNRKVQNINAHHLDGWHWAIDKRFDINNGVTLCEECHVEFHRIYKRGNNTKEQFDEWIGAVN